jgi:hypothetical protein
MLRGKDSGRTFQQADQLSEGNLILRGPTKKARAEMRR